MRYEKAAKDLFLTLLFFEILNFQDRYKGTRIKQSMASFGNNENQKLKFVSVSTPKHTKFLFFSDAISNYNNYWWTSKDDVLSILLLFSLIAGMSSRFGDERCVSTFFIQFSSSYILLLFNFALILWHVVVILSIRSYTAY